MSNIRTCAQLRSDYRQPRFFPGPSGRYRPGGNDSRAGGRPGIDVVALTPEETKFGAWKLSKRPRAVPSFSRSIATTIEGVIVSLPNFGDERAIADTLRLADLNVPVLVQATPDYAGKMTIRDRRDSFCGKMSACNNLMQYGIPYSLTTLHTEAPDLRSLPKIWTGLSAYAAWSVACADCASALSARVRPHSTPSATAKNCLKPTASRSSPIDLSEILGRIDRMKDEDPAAQDKLHAIQSTSRPATCPRRR